jgi:hypothetical protein
METESSQKVAEKFHCEWCDYYTSKKTNYTKHTFTAKHQKATKLTKVIKKVAESSQKVATCQTFSCEKCYKPYTSRAGLWKHLKNCNDSTNNFDFTDKELIMTLLKENNELKTMMIEQQNAVIELCKNGTNNTVHNNSHNKTFNLQFFLNETCKDAMNLMDFVQSIQLQLTDLEKVGEIGYVDGISNIIVKNLKDLNITQRPIHCTDKKREILYIKDENKWEKEDDENNKIRKAIKHVAYKNTKLLSQFREKHPDCGKSESLYSDQYNKLIIEAMGGKGVSDTEKDKKIIKNIVKEVIIDK